MRKFILLNLFNLFVVLSIVLTNNLIYASDDIFNVETIINHINDNQVIESNDEYIIYGNIDYKVSDFEKIFSNSNAKVGLIYKTKKDIELDTDAIIYIKTNSNIFSYEFEEYENVNSKVLIYEIKEFVTKYLILFNDKKYYTLENSVSAVLTETPTTFVNCQVEKEYVTRFTNMGYIVYHIAVNKYIANKDSILYIVTVNNQFVPGVMANNNGESGYNNYYNYSGYVHMTVEQAYDSTEAYIDGSNRYGNVPYKKDYWPLNESHVATISSSINKGLNLGYSYTNGFSLDNITVQSKSDYGVNISYNYNKAITKDEPSLSVQTNSENLDMVEWYYKYNAKLVEETYNLQTNYMFEIANSRKDMFIGDFRLKLDYMFGLKSRRVYTKTFSKDLIVRAGEYNEIHDFNNGNF